MTRATSEGSAPEGRDAQPPCRRAPRRSWSGWLLVSVFLIGACTVRVELASNRPVPGDLAAGSTGLTGQGRWLDATPVTPDEAATDGVAIADIQASGRSPHLLVRLRPREAGPARAASERGSAGIATARLPLPPPAKPVRIAAAGAGAPPDAAPAARDAAAGPPAAPAMRTAVVAGWPDAAEPPAAASPLRAAGIAPDALPAPNLVVAPGIELARPGTRYQLARLALARPDSIAPAAGPAARAPDAPGSPLQFGQQDWPLPARPGPIRLFFTSPAHPT